LIKKLIKALERILSVIATLSFSCFFFGIFLAILLRYVFSFPIVWSEEIAGVAAAWMVFSGAAVAVLRREHIRIDIIPRLRWFKGRVALIHHVFSTLVMLSFSVALTVAGFNVVRGNWERLLPALEWPYAVLYLSSLVGGAAMTVFLVVQLFRPGQPGATDEAWGATDDRARPSPE
jgi:TRAP-type C4-dicarboxylate transport system permease small subunit